MIKVLFFARLREALNCESLELEFDNKSIAELKTALVELHPDWQSALTKTKLLSAVNQTMVNEDTLLKAGDEVAFFPPVTGG